MATITISKMKSNFALGPTESEQAKETEEENYLHSEPAILNKQWNL